MSIKAMSRVWETSKQSGAGLLMLLAIADYAKDDGSGAWPSYETLAKKTRTKRRAAIRMVQKLEATGELKVLRGEGPYSTNLYQIIYPLVSPTTPPKKAASVVLATRGVSPTTPDLVSPTTPDPSLEPSLNRHVAQAPEFDELFPGKPSEGKTADRPYFHELDKNERQAIALGLTATARASKILGDWNPRSNEVRVGLIHFLTATRLTVPRKKSERLFWENEVQDHVLDYGLDRLEKWYKQAAEDCRDLPLREGRSGDVLSIKSPKSISFKLAEYNATAGISSANGKVPVDWSSERQAEYERLRQREQRTE